MSSSAPTVMKFEDPAARRKRLAQEWAEERTRLMKNGKKHTNPKANGNTCKPGVSDPNDCFDVEQARFEVLKFSIDNDMQRDRRLNAKQRLLVQLGAKPPKNTYTNYKKLKEDIKAKKVEETTSLHSGDTTGVKSQLSKRKVKGSGHRQIDVTAGYGKLRNGELIVDADTRKVFRRVQEKAKRLQQQRAPMGGAGGPKAAAGGNRRPKGKRGPP